MALTDFERITNLCGCLHSQMDWDEWANWLSFGAFKKEKLFRTQTYFVFDKDKIRHEIQRNLFRFRYCPYLRFGLIDAVIDALPRHVSPRSEAWRRRSCSLVQLPASLAVRLSRLRRRRKWSHGDLASHPSNSKRALGTNGRWAY